MDLRVKEICKEKGILFKELADKVGVSDVGLRKQVQGNPTIETLGKIAAALNVEVWELFECKGQTELTALVEYQNEFYKAETLEELRTVVDTIENKRLL